MHVIWLKYCLAYKSSEILGSDITEQVISPPMAFSF